MSALQLAARHPGSAGRGHDTTLFIEPEAMGAFCGAFLAWSKRYEPELAGLRSRSPAGCRPTIAVSPFRPPKVGGGLASDGRAATKAGTRPQAWRVGPRAGEMALRTAPAPLDPARGTGGGLRRHPEEPRRSALEREKQATRIGSHGRPFRPTTVRPVRPTVTFVGNNRPARYPRRLRKGGPTCQRKMMCAQRQQGSTRP